MRSWKRFFCSSLLMCRKNFRIFTLIVVQQFLELVDLIVALRPDVFGHQIVDAHDEHVFVVRAVEDSDVAVFGNGLVNAPEKIVRHFLRGRLLERRSPCSPADSRRTSRGGWCRPFRPRRGPAGRSAARACARRRAGIAACRGARTALSRLAFILWPFSQPSVSSGSHFPSFTFFPGVTRSSLLKLVAISSLASCRAPNVELCAPASTLPQCATRRKRSRLRTDRAAKAAQGAQCSFFRRSAI